MSNNSSNTSLALYGAKSTAEQYIWSTWALFVLLSTVSGSVVVLVSTIRYRAFELHTAIVTFIQHIAVCDLVLVMALILPQTISLISGRWILGHGIHFVNTYVTRLCYPASMLLIAALTSTKLFLVKCPLKARLFTKKRAHMIVAGIWILSLYYPGTLMMVDKDDTFFDLRLYTGMYKFSDKIWRLLIPIVFGLMTVLPNLLIIVTSVMLIIHLIRARKVARRSSGQVRWQGIATVLLSATVFVLSSIPLTVYNYCASYVPATKVWFHVYFFRVSYNLLYINVIGNVVIYVITVPSFRKFLFATAKSRDSLTSKVTTRTLTIDSKIINEKTEGEFFSNSTARFDSAKI
ncbi:hypothetical protein ACHWQZ_G006339 [Mnemiopsis leidyi]